MKILRKGELPTAAATPWWVGKTAECRVCGCQVLLELENVFSSQITGAAGAREFNPAPAKP
jgi:hypothetical protein